MTAWILTISPQFPEHAGYAIEDGFWDTRVRRRIQSGDDVFFWVSESGLNSWVRATSGMRVISAGDQRARWQDREAGRYLYRFEFEVKSAVLRTDERWKTIAAASGITQPLSNGAVEVPKAGIKYIKSLFDTPLASQTRFDITIPEYTLGEDLRRRAVKVIAVRRGQENFRDSLIDAYESRCAVTGSEVRAILEAAHIDRYFGDNSHHVTNGILLRCDLHALFDLQRLTIDADFRVRVSPTLRESEYGDLDGKQIRLPARPQWRPDVGALTRHAAGCSWLSVDR